MNPILISMEVWREANRKALIRFILLKLAMERRHEDKLSILHDATDVEIEQINQAIELLTEQQMRINRGSAEPLELSEKDMFYLMYFDEKNATVRQMVDKQIEQQGPYTAYHRFNQSKLAKELVFRIDKPTHTRIKSQVFGLPPDDILELEKLSEKKFKTIEDIELLNLSNYYKQEQEKTRKAKAKKK